MPQITLIFYYFQDVTLQTNHPSAFIGQICVPFFIFELRLLGENGIVKLVNGGE